MQGEPAASRRPLDPPGVLRRIGPFLAAGVLAFAPLALPPENEDKAPIVAAAVISAVTIAGAFVLPWRRLPDWAHAFPPIVYFLVVALLREAEGGATSGYSPLLILPLLWFALYGTRVQVVVATLLAAATLILPILLQGSPHYPDSEWRRTIVWLAVSPVVGFTVQGLVRRIEQLARTDPLTGLPNRRTWEEELEKWLARTRRSDEAISIAILDIDHFKRFNDTRGHQAGDLLLSEAAEAWRNELREGDVVARYGGEEFGVLLYGTPLDRAEVVIERLRGATPAGQTVSAGIAQSEKGETVDDLIRRADDALYQAKRAGRDKAMSSGGARSRRG